MKKGKPESAAVIMLQDIDIIMMKYRLLCLSMMERTGSDSPWRPS
jgi:hypothetical protein